MQGETLDFRKIALGAPAAERDRALAGYFVESDAFKNVVDGKKYILLGNRGSGKSAIFKVLAARAKGAKSLIIELSPDDYSYEMLKSCLKSEKEGSWAKHGAYTVGWKYILFIQIMKALNDGGKGFKRGSSAKIYTYLRDHIKGEQTNPIGALISFLKRLEGIKVASYEAKLKTHELQSLYKLEEIEPLIPEILSLCKLKRTFVLIDELDKGWDSSEDAKAFISGLVQAANSINQYTPDLRVVVSLRQELYDSIPSLYEDAQKFRDVMEFVSWDETSLLKLLAARLRHALPNLKNADDIEVWNAVFPETLDFRKTKSFHYLVDRTLYRPREIIQFVTDVVEHAGKEGAHSINYERISSAEVNYSKARTQDIAAEYKFQYPGLMHVFEAFRGKNYSFARNEAEAIATEIGLDDRLNLPTGSWAYLQDPDVILHVLWKIGFIRAYAVGGVKAKRRSGSQYVGSHQIDNLDIRSVTRFQVHPMFRTFLSMKEGKGTKEED